MDKYISVISGENHSFSRPERGGKGMDVKEQVQVSKMLTQTQDILCYCIMIVIFLSRAPSDLYSATLYYTLFSYSSSSTTCAVLPAIITHQHSPISQFLILYTFYR